MKYSKILNDTWEFLENNYKGSEINMEMWLDLVEKESDNKNCLKNCIILLWNTWEFYTIEEHDYYKKYIKDNYNIKVK